MPLTLKRMIQNNPVSHAVDLVGEAWTMLILREAFQGARRFDDWLGRLTISRSVLARRLKAMCEAGLLEPRRYQTRPERFEYVLSAMGRDLYGVAVMLILWEQDWSPRADPARAIKLVRRSDGADVIPVMAGEDPHAALRPDEVHPAPGPDPDFAPRLKALRRRRVQPAQRGRDGRIELGVELFGDYWTNLVLAACFYRIRRYDDFLANLDISTSVLAERLASLVEHGVLERRRYQTRPERFEYVLTAMGRALYPVVLAFLAWGSRWACGAQRTPVVLISNATGKVVEPSLRDAVTGERLDPRAVRPAPLHSDAQRQRAGARG
mgnify:CR=1 FL=1